MENRDLQGSWGGATVRQDYAMMMMMNEAGSLFRKQGDAQRNEQSVIFKESDDDGRERVTEEEERVSI